MYKYLLNITSEQKSLNIKELIIPSTMKTISDFAFKNVELTNLVLKEGVEEIRGQAFMNSNLKTLEIPSTVKRIGVYAFQNSRLAMLILHDGLESIGGNAFEHSYLSNLELPNTVKFIGGDAFRWAPITKLTLSNSLETIGDYTFYEGDLLDQDLLEQIFTKEEITYVIHFAALKAVGESVAYPLKYYENNIAGTLQLLNIMKKYSVKRMIFSSSATVYGAAKEVPIKESADLFVTNPYGRTKLMLEEILKDVYISDNDWSIVLLRYFNPIGAHKSGLIGENPKSVPNNLIPYITQVAVGKLDYLRVFGDDYDTKDGTGVRDYIHVVDLAKGHVKAKKCFDQSGVYVYNLGTGTGYSVLEILHMFEEVCGKEIPYKIVERRPGDIGTCYADVEKAYKELGFKAELGIKDMCEDSWRWQSQNPNGY